MNGFLLLLKLERRTILYGLAVCFLLIFPFTFLPTLVQFGFDIEAIRARWWTSTCYALGCSAIVVILVTVYNYDNLVIKKWYFDQPAFKALDFSGGIGSFENILEELETVLIGQIECYYFRISLLNVEKSDPAIKIIPLIAISDKEKEIEALIQQNGFEVDTYLLRRIQLDTVNLRDTEAIKHMLKQLAARLKELQFQPLKFSR